MVIFFIFGFSLSCFFFICFHFVTANKKKQERESIAPRRTHLVERVHTAGCITLLRSGEAIHTAGRVAAAAGWGGGCRTWGDEPGRRAADTAEDVATTLHFAPYAKAQSVGAQGLAGHGENLLLKLFLLAKGKLKIFYYITNFTGMTYPPPPVHASTGGGGYGLFPGAGSPHYYI
jgi:hypothetical protein